MFAAGDLNVNSATETTEHRPVDDVSVDALTLCRLHDLSDIEHGDEQLKLPHTLHKPIKFQQNRAIGR